MHDCQIAKTQKLENVIRLTHAQTAQWLRLAL